MDCPACPERTGLVVRRSQLPRFDGEGHQALKERPDVPGLRKRCGDSTVLDQTLGEVASQRFAMLRGPIQLSMMNTVSHELYPLSRKSRDRSKRRRGITPAS